MDNERKYYYNRYTDNEKTEWYLGRNYHEKKNTANDCDF